MVQWCTLASKETRNSMFLCWFYEISMENLNGVTPIFHNNSEREIRENNWSINLSNVLMI